MNESYWIYILFCNNNSYYTGFTTHLIKRYRLHLQGKASKYTRSFKPIYLAQCWNIKGNKSLALKVEQRIKTLSRLEKEKMIADPTLLYQKFFISS